jgi:hypothetical protein
MCNRSYPHDEDCHTDHTGTHDDVETGDCEDSSYPHDHDYYAERTNADDEGEAQHSDGPMTTRSTFAHGQTNVVVEGCAPQNELDTPETCRRLAGALTLRDRRAWSVVDVRPRPDYVDGYVRAESEPVAVQATIVGSFDRWRLLNTTGSVRSTLPFTEAAAEIWDAIQKKRLAQDPRMILALRGHPGIHPIQPVVDEFHQIHGAELRSVRWREIWLIGPSPEVSFCLWPLPSSDPSPQL